VLVTLIHANAEKPFLRLTFSRLHFCILTKVAQINIAILRT